MSELECKDCQWRGDWKELKPLKLDGEHIPACPTCTGINFEELTEDDEEESDGNTAT